MESSNWKKIEQEIRQKVTPPETPKVMTKEDVMTALGHQKQGQAYAIMAFYDLPEELRTDFKKEKMTMQANRDSWDEFFIEHGFEETDCQHNF